MQNDLRWWITLVEGKIVYRDREFIVILNPAKPEVTRLADKANHGEGLRAIISMGDLYIWDGYFANHDEIARKLGLLPDAELHLWTAYVELDAVGLRMGHDEDDEDDPDYNDDPEVAEVAATIRSNPCIQRLYGANVDIKADFGDDERWL